MLRRDRASSRARRCGNGWRSSRSSPKLRATLARQDEAEVRAALGMDDGPLEGWLFPDTYRFAPGSDRRRAPQARARGDEEAPRRGLGSARDPSVPLKTPYEALILASIVEKETGAAAERPLVASVFVNRLRKGMRLQTDPTVIYGMGEKFDGNIRKRDLTTDTPWNTYTRDGLPPTPIAMPGAASLARGHAPGASEFLYFVGKGDGTHQFSRTLEEHNRAVAKYQLEEMSARGTIHHLRGHRRRGQVLAPRTSLCARVRARGARGRAHARARRHALRARSCARSCCTSR